MAEDYYTGFDYYNADPPRESAAPPPEESSAPAPEDEYNEQINTKSPPKRKKKSLAFMLAVSGLAVSFAVPGVGMLPSASEPTEESSVIESAVTESSVSTPAESAVIASVTTPTPAPAPVPTPVPIPTEDLRLRLDSFEIYPLSKGYLAEVRFTLATNSGIGISSVSGAIDSRLFIYDGYDAKKKKVKSHYEDFHKEFSMDAAKAVCGSGAESSENSYVLLVPFTEGSSEDKFSVTLTVSNTLNGNKTEDKVATLKDIGLWNEETDSYSSSMLNVSVTKNADKTFDVSVSPKPGITVSKLDFNTLFAASGGKYTSDLELKDFILTYDADMINIAFKKPSKAPGSGSLWGRLYADFEMTDSNGKTYTGTCLHPFRYRY